MLKIQKINFLVTKDENTKDKIFKIQKNFKVHLKFKNTKEDINLR